MDMPEIPLPGEPRGTPEQQLRQMYVYLYQLAEQLNNMFALVTNKRGDDDNAN